MKHPLLLAMLPAMLSACAPPGRAPEVIPAGAPALPGSGAMINLLPVVNGTIEGEPVTMLLDTGASITCVKLGATGRIGRKAVGTSNLGGVGDTTHTVTTFGQATLVLGEFTTAIASLHECPALSLLGPSASAIDGVLGADALRGLTVVIDYPESSVDVLPVWSPVASDSAAALPIRFIGGLPVITIDLQVRGRWEPVSLLLDTGADASLLLDAATADTLGLESDPFHPPIDRRGLGGVVATRPFYVSRARLGTLDVRDLHIEVAGAGLGHLLEHGIQGIAGGDFLRHFRLGLDLGHARLSIDSPGPSRSVCGSRSGICVAPRAVRDGYVVQSVRPRSMAARYSITAGEVILRVGPVDAARMSAAELRAALAPANGLVSLWVLNTFGRARLVEFRIWE